MLKLEITKVIVKSKEGRNSTQRQVPIYLGNCIKNGEKDEIFHLPTNNLGYHPTCPSLSMTPSRKVEEKNKKKMPMRRCVRTPQQSNAMKG